ncbi:MAG TPA: HlyD family efflux transporter periplasmic adaptor subunit [Terriglobales bacterium]
MDIVRDESFKRKKRRNQVLLTVVALLVLVGITVAVSRLQPADPVVEWGTVWPDTVKRGSMYREVHGIGSLVPIPEDIRLIPAETDVRVERILELPGAVVKPETVIMELSNPQVQQEAVSSDLDLKSAEAEWHNTKAKVDGELLTIRAEAATVEADYENAKRDLEQKAELNKIGVVSASEVKIAQAKMKEMATRNQIEQDRIAESTKAVETQLDVQKATIESKRAMAQLKHKQLDALKVRAGISGELSEVPVQVGQRATQGTILAKVVQPDHLKAELKIPETQAKDIMRGQGASIDTHNGIVKGTVERIDPSVQNGTVTVDVKLTEPPPHGSRVDLSVDGTITLERLDDVLYVGRPAFGQEKTTVSMFKVEADGKHASKAKVELGRSSVTNIEIVRGLKEGDTVILSDMSRYDNVDKIRLDR